MTKKIILKYSFKLCIIFIFNVAHAGYYSEYIKSFDTNIEVEKDGIVNIEENIAVKSNLEKIKHGIFRAIPTIYKNNWGIKSIVNLKINYVLLNGLPTEYTVSTIENGQIIKIGSPLKYLSPGEYKYTIGYSVNKQIGFYSKDGYDYSELYWNITGNDWSFPIIKASANIMLPKEIPSNKIAIAGYTGYFGDTYRSYTSNIDKNIVHISTTQVLYPKQGLTVAVLWPQGFIKKPSTLEKYKNMIADNWDILWYLLWSILLFIYAIFTYIKSKNLLTKRTIIPLFHPPKNLTPGGLRYIKNKKWDNVVLAADIVDMAVKGLINIEHNAGFFSSEYTLIKKEASLENINEYYKNLLYVLFYESDKLAINNSFNQNINNAIKISENFYSKKYYDLFNKNELKMSPFWIVFFIVCIMPIIFNYGQITLYAMLFGFIMGLFGVLYSKMMHMYSQKGLNLSNEIDGFKMYLETTETDRLKFLSTPPIKTPELYEKLLPYAIALNVEKSWAQQFAPIFKKLELEGHAYHPRWYLGNISRFNPYAFSSSINYNLNRAISSSGTIPGTSSGSFGGGRSGGGGGGGGGGGW